MKESRLALTSAIVLALGTATSAQAVDFTVSGQVSRAILFPDDAAGSEVQHVDNNASGSRIRVKAKQDIGNGMKMGARYELQLQENKGNAVNGGSLKEEANSTLDVRYSDIWVSGGFGKLSLGKGDGASNGTTEMDMSGTYMPAPANMMDMLGGLQYEAGKKVGSVYTMYDGYSRNNRLRYDSPKMSGLSLALSSAQGNSIEIALRYSGEIGGVKVQGAIFSDDAGDHPSRKDTQGGSIAVLLPSGFNALVAYSTRDGGANDDPAVVWTKLGYKTGKHSVSVDFGQASDVTAGIDADTAAVAYTFRPAKGIETYAAYRTFNVDTDDSVDPTVFIIGSRVKF